LSDGFQQFRLNGFAFGSFVPVSDKEGPSGKLEFDDGDQNIPFVTVIGHLPGFESTLAFFRRFF